MVFCLQVRSLKPFCELPCLIFADNCKKLGLVFDDVVGIVEIINSRDIKVQVSVDALLSACIATAAQGAGSTCLWGKLDFWNNNRHL